MLKSTLTLKYSGELVKVTFINKGDESVIKIPMNKIGRQQISTMANVKDHLFDEVNEFISDVFDNQHKEKLFNLYKKASEIKFPFVINKTAFHKVFGELFIFLNSEEMLGNLHGFNAIRNTDPDIKEEYNETRIFQRGSNKFKDKTYIKNDLNWLLTFIMQLKMCLPMINVFYKFCPDKDLNKHNRLSSHDSMLSEIFDRFPEHPAIEKMLLYINIFVEETPDIEYVSLKTMSVDDLIHNVYFILILKKLPYYSLKSNVQTVPFLYKSTEKIINSFQKTVTSSVRQASSFDSGDEDGMNKGVIDSFRARESLSEIRLVQANRHASRYRDTARFVLGRELTDSESETLEDFISLKPSMMNLDLDVEQVQEVIIIYVLSKNNVFSINILKEIDEVNYRTTVGVCAFCLSVWGFNELSKLLLSSRLMDDEGNLYGGNFSNTSLSDASKNKLLELCPFSFEKGLRNNTHLSNPVVEAVLNLAISIKQSSWELLKSPFIERHFGIEDSYEWEPSNNIQNEIADLVYMADK